MKYLLTTSLICLCFTLNAQVFKNAVINHSTSFNYENKFNKKRNRIGLSYMTYTNSDKISDVLCLNIGLNYNYALENRRSNFDVLTGLSLISLVSLNYGYSISGHYNYLQTKLQYYPLFFKLGGFHGGKGSILQLMFVSLHYNRILTTFVQNKNVVGFGVGFMLSWD